MFASLSGILDYIRSYYNAVFNKDYFIAIIAMMAMLISVNYSYPFTTNSNPWLSFLSDYLLFLLPFAFAWLLQWFYFEDERTHFFQPGFWLLVFIAPAIFAFRINFDQHLRNAGTSHFDSALHLPLAVVNYLLKGLVIILPVAAIWFFKDKENFRLYGFSRHRNHTAYFLLLGLMIPLIILASTFPDFLNTYPKALRDTGLHSSSSLYHFILYELAYGLDFLSIEFFFRGFLVIAFIKYCGMKAIIPAACFYCCIHFGKPMPEAISSFFGGLLLGIISYHTLSIWGGLLIHVGIAWLMEIAAYVSHHF